MHNFSGNRQRNKQLLGLPLMLSHSDSNPISCYYVLVSEWGTKTLVSVHATSAQSAEQIARQNAGKKDGWEGIHKVYNAFPVGSRDVDGVTVDKTIS